MEKCEAGCVKVHPLVLQGRPERRHLYQWVNGEEPYVAAKFDDQRNGHDDHMAGCNINSFWGRQIIQYLDRAQVFFHAASEGPAGADRRHLELMGQQALAKAFMTAKGCVESSIRVFGPLPMPGVSSGNVTEWDRAVTE